MPAPPHPDHVRVGNHSDCVMTAQPVGAQAHGGAIVYLTDFFELPVAAVSRGYGPIACPLSECSRLGVLRPTSCLSWGFPVRSFSCPGPSADVGGPRFFGPPRVRGWWIKLGKGSALPGRTGAARAADRTPVLSDVARRHCSGRAPGGVSGGDDGGSLAVHCGGEHGRGAHPERGVRPAVVVVLAPVADHHPRLGQAGELLDVEQLVAHAGVEALDERVLPRRAGLDERRPGPRELTPVPGARARSSPGRCPSAGSSGRAALGDQPLQRRDDRVGVDAALDQHHQRLAGELVDDVEQLQRPPVGGLVELEVERPHVVRAARRAAAGRHASSRPAGGACACAAGTRRPSSRHSRCTRLRFTSQPCSRSR